MSGASECIDGIRERMVKRFMKSYKLKNSPKCYGDIHTSKGNQLKWFEDGYWFKADQFGYEGIAEAVVTYFLQCCVSVCEI